MTSDERGIPGYPGKRVKVRKSQMTGNWYWSCPCSRGRGGHRSREGAMRAVWTHLRYGHGVPSRRR